MATLENFLSTVADQTNDFRVLYELGSLRALQKRITDLEDVALAYAPEAVLDRLELNEREKT